MTECSSVWSACVLGEVGCTSVRVSRSYYEHLDPRKVLLPSRSSTDTLRSVPTASTRVAVRATHWPSLHPGYTNHVFPHAWHQIILPLPISIILHSSMSLGCSHHLPHRSLYRTTSQEFHSHITTRTTFREPLIFFGRTTLPGSFQVSQRVPLATTL